MRFLLRFLLGNGTLKPELRQQLEAEGLVLVEEGLLGSVRYDHFKAPGKRFNGKVTGAMMGIGLSAERVVVYCYSGRAELVDSPWSSPYWEMVDVLAEDGRLKLNVDYDKGGEANTSGQVSIRMRTPEAARIAAEINGRLAR